MAAPAHRSVALSPDVTERLLPGCVTIFVRGQKLINLGGPEYLCDRKSLPEAVHSKDAPVRFETQYAMEVCLRRNSFRQRAAEGRQPQHPSDIEGHVTEAHFSAADMENPQHN